MKLILLVAAIAAGAHACLREHHHHRHSSNVQRRDPSPTSPPVLDANEATLVQSFDNSSIATWSYYYTHGYHVAGGNQSMAQWTADRWNEFGFSAHLAEYYVYLNYPVSHSLQLDYANGSFYMPSLEEQVLAEDDVTSYPNRVPTFHGYSATGDASAEYVYVGRGQQVDFDRLRALGVPLEGRIALARYGGPFRGLKVKNAQENGMIGCVIFTDPGDDGNVTEANGYTAYPNGPARNPSSVQRGSVQFLSIYPGDPTTPGYPSKRDSPRASRSSSVPQIPSLPISWQEAVPLLAALDGYGTDGEAVNRTRWVGALNVSYSTGPSPGTTISMSNVMRDETTSIWNTIGIINGTSQDEVVIVGNHRDAWIIGGAADPNSGSAIMVELSKAFGQLLAQGWQPRRTIVLASWDAEEYGLVGSTEWVEEYIPWLTEATVSYLNIDVGVSGPIPDLSATPDLHDIATNVMKKVIWPYRGTTNRTLYDVWFEESEGEVGVLGSGSDYTSFVHRGISAVDMGAGGGPDDPIYHYHSNYDSYHWMSTYGDPGFVHHRAMGQYLSLLLYHLADDEFLPTNPQTYTTEMNSYFSSLEETIAASDPPITLDLSALRDAITDFGLRANESAALRDQAISTADPNLMTVINRKHRDFQRGFTSQGGLPGREFFRHVIFAPGLDTGYAPTTFPGITEAVEGGNAELAMEWVGRTSRAITVAADILKT